MTDTESSPEDVIHRSRFLLVDEDASNLELIERYLLMSAAAMVRKVPSPLLALRVLQDVRTPSDCVMCAHSMTPMSGLQFLVNLRSGRYGKPLRNINFVLTMKEKDDAVVEIANSWLVNGYVFGPIERESLMAAVVNALTPAGETQGPKGTSGVQPREHLWTQWYCTEQSSEKIGSIDLVFDPAAAPATPFIVKVKEGIALFPSRDDAEAWLQKRVRSGAKLKRC